MALWGKTDTATESGKPKWLARAATGVGRLEDCYATQSGWVLKHTTSGGTREEVLCAIKNLAGSQTVTDTLGAANITAAFFEQEALSQGDTGTVVVIFNEQVDVTGTPTLGVTGSVSGAGAVTASYARGTGSNRLEFDFTVPSQAEVLSIADQTIGGAGSVKDKGTTVDSEDAFAGKTVGAGGSGTDLTLTIS